MSHEMCIWFVFVVVVVLAPSNLDGSSLFIGYDYTAYTLSTVPRKAVKFNHLLSRLLYLYWGYCQNASEITLKDMGKN